MWWWAGLNFAFLANGRGEPLLSGEKQIPRPENGLVMTTPERGASALWDHSKGRDVSERSTTSRFVNRPSLIFDFAANRAV
jgi:hypothetical protein